MATEIVFEIDADPAVDVLTTGLDGEPRRLTIHRGRIALYELDPGLFRWALTGITVERALWLPDGVGYREPPERVSAQMGTAQLHVPVQGGHQSGLAGWSAAAEPDPRGTGLWFVRLRISAFLDTRPSVFTYDVHVLADPSTVEAAA